MDANQRQGDDKSRQVSSEVTPTDDGILSEPTRRWRLLPPADAVLSTAEAAEVLGVHVDTVKSQIRARMIDARKIGGSKGYLISGAALRRYLRVP